MINSKALAVFLAFSLCCCQGDQLKISTGFLPVLPELSDEIFSSYIVEREAPDWNLPYPTDLAGMPAEMAEWRRKTVIVDTGDGFGSGAVISKDGYALTNYHVVESALNRASLSGEIPKVNIITCVVSGAKISKSNLPLVGIVVGADPSKDLAMIKISLGTSSLPFFELGSNLELGEMCFAVGSPGGGLPWAVRQGSVSGLYDYPGSLTDLMVFGERSIEMSERLNSEVLLTDIPISPGDSGGPLINSEGQLIGITFATPNNLSGGSVGYHIYLSEIVEFVKSYGENGLPPDIWTGVNPGYLGSVLKKFDINNNGNIDFLVFTILGSDEEDPVLGHLFCVSSKDNFPMEYSGTILPKGIWGVDSSDANFSTTSAFLILANNAVWYAAFSSDEKTKTVFLELPDSRSFATDFRWEESKQGVHWTRSTSKGAAPFSGVERLAYQRVFEYVKKN
jgi:S1-C subfamily serine protease